MKSSSHSTVPSITASFSTLSSTSVTPTAARNDCVLMEDDSATTVARLFSNNDYTPPHKSRDFLVCDVEEEINALLAPLGKSWSELTEIDKVKLSFLHMKHFAEIAEDKSKDKDDDTRNLTIAQAAWNSLNEKHYCGRRLSEFIRKGGDSTPKEGDVVPSDALNNFLHEKDQWNDHEEAPTIFNNPNASNRNSASVPMMRFQPDDSTVCNLLAVANCIFYNMRNQNGDSHDECDAHYCLNINGYMRNKFSDEETFGYIFQGNGGDAHQQLFEMLQQCNPNIRPNKLVGYLELHNYQLKEERGVEVFFETVKRRLFANGPFIIEEFKPFEDLVKNDNKLEFGGNWTDYVRIQAPPSFFQLEQPCLMYHALLVVGVRRTASLAEMGGLQFLLQNSCAAKPFAVAGLDLIASMDIDRFIYVKNGLSFDPGECDRPDSPSVTLSGTPRNGEMGLGQAFSPAVSGGDDNFARLPSYYFHKIKDPTKPHVFYSG